MISSKDLHQERADEQIVTGTYNSFRDADESSNAPSELNRSRVSHTSKRPSHGASSHGRQRRKARKKASSNDSDQEVDEVLAFEEKKIEVSLGDSTFKPQKERDKKPKGVKESNKDIKDELDSNLFSGKDDP